MVKKPVKRTKAKAGKVKTVGVVAPYTARLGKRSGGPVSFNAYFLRDLYSKGKLTDATIKEIVKENGIKNSSLREVMSAIRKTNGEAIGRNVSMDLEAIAAIAADLN